MSAEFARTNAAKAWLRRVETLHAGRPDPALITARRIARNSPHDVAIAGHAVHVILSDRHQHHQLTLTIPSWTLAETEVVDKLLGRYPGTELDDLPIEFVAALRDHHVELAPHLAEVRLSPSTAPRRLALAAFYKLIQRVDEDPRQALTLRIPEQARHPAAPAPVTWIPLSDLDPNRYFSGPET